MLQERYRWFLLGWLFGDRIIYTLNWLAISPAQPFIAKELGADITSLGLLGAVFLVGIGGFQIPAGLVASRYGPRRTAFFGLGLSSFFSFLCGLAPSFELLLIFRFLTGTFMSFFFGPGIAFIIPYFSVKERGVALGLYNGGFHVGSLIALGAWPFIITSMGWRLGLVMPGALGVLMAAATLAVSKSGEKKPVEKKVELSILKNKVVWLSALGLTFSGGSWYPLTQFGILYLNSDVGLGLETAGLLMASMSVGSVVASPFMGRMYDSAPSKKIFITAVNAAIAAAITAVSVKNVAVISSSVFILGILYMGVYTVYYLIPMERVDVRDVPVAIALVNSVQLVAGSVLPYLFASAAAGFGYGFAWMLLGAVSALSLAVSSRIRFN
ncbi:MAG: MFS transporter [Candidatus Caldarchaeum sp.]